MKRGFTEMAGTNVGWVMRCVKGMVASTMLAGLCLLLTSCAQRQTSSTWYNPSWTPSGNIMAVREDSTYYSGGGGLLGGGGAADTNCVLVEMGPDGSNERVLMELGREVTPRINVSPLGTYFALHENQSKVIRIYRRVDMGLVKEIVRDVNVAGYDWSPNEQYLAIGGGGGFYYDL